MVFRNRFDARMDLVSRWNLASGRYWHLRYWDLDFLERGEQMLVGEVVCHTLQQTSTGP